MDDNYKNITTKTDAEYDFKEKKQKLEAEFEQSKKKLRLTVLMTIVAIIILLLLCIAWFVFNNRVNGVASNISAKASPILFATSGDVDNEGSEDSWLEQSLGILKGNIREVDGKNYYVTDSGAIRLNVDSYSNFNNEYDDRGIMPGASGKITFFIIVDEDSYSEITCDMDVRAYKGSDDERELVTDSQLRKLIDGHILCFRNYNAVSGYSNWIKDKKFTIKASNYRDDNGNTLTAFEKGKAYPITVYWIWPKLFENFIQPDRNEDGTLEDGVLFSDSQDAQNEAREIRSDMLNDKNRASNPDDKCKYFYGYDSSKVGNIDDITNVNASQFNYLSEWYNDGDYYVGTEMQYIYLEFKNAGEAKHD